MTATIGEDPGLTADERRERARRFKVAGELRANRQKLERIETKMATARGAQLVALKEKRKACRFAIEQGTQDLSIEAVGVLN